MAYNGKNIIVEPAISLLKHIAVQINKSNCTIVAYYIPAGQSNYELKVYRNEKISTIKSPGASIKSFFDINTIKSNINILSTDRLPSVILHELQPPARLFSQEEKSSINHSLVVQVYSHSLKTNVFYILLLDKELQDSIQAIFTQQGLPVDRTKLFTYVKLYFKLFLISYENYLENEFIKYNYSKGLVETVQKELSRNHILSDKLKKIEELDKKDLIKDAKNILEKHTINYDKQYEFTGDALKLIGDYKGNKDRFHTAIQEAIELSHRVSPFSIGDKVFITPEMIQFDSIVGVDENPDHKKERMNKAEKFLDKYEEAARLVELSPDDLNIKSLASKVRPYKVTPSAISINIRNYKKEIALLLDMQKGNWPIIRKQFKPVAKLIEVS